MTEDEDAPEIKSRFDVPDEWRVGVYANNVNVWHSPYEFTLDFSVTDPPELDDPEDPSAGVTIPNNVVARVRIPVGLVFDMIVAINGNMETYARSWGEPMRPEFRGTDEPTADEGPDE